MVLFVTPHSLCLSHSPPIICFNPPDPICGNAQGMKYIVNQTGSESSKKEYSKRKSLLIL